MPTDESSASMGRSTSLSCIDHDNGLLTSAINAEEFFVSESSITSLTFVAEAHIMPPSASHRRLVFTINNPTDDVEQALGDHLESPHVTYAVVGREVAPTTGTPHLQGFIIYKNPQRFSFFHRHVTSACHLEVARAKSSVASDYCKKDGDFEEYGQLPSEQGRRTDLENFQAWVQSQAVQPSERSIARQFPALYLRYRSTLLDLAVHLRPGPQLMLGEPELRDWQQGLDDLLDEDPDDRTISFYVDPEGAKGKSYFMRYYLSKKPDDVQCLSVGKRDDLAYAIDPTKTIFFFDIPRGCMEYLQYPVLEQLKDRVIFSAKYQSTTKFIDHNVHVIVFCNEFPDEEKLSEDRFHIVRLD